MSTYTGAHIVAELTADGRSIVLMATGSDEDVAYAAKWLTRLTPPIKKSDPPGAVVVPLSWPAVVQLSRTYGDAWRTGPRLTEWTRQQVVARMSPVPSSYDAPPPLYTLPAGLEPRPYQRDGAHVIATTSFGKPLITDEPGTGKTITTILGLLERDLHGKQTWPVLVVAPASVVDPWVREWNTWAPHLSVATYRGTPQRRRSMAGAQPRAHVYVCSYDIATRDAPVGKLNQDTPLLTLGARSVVVDECHLIKSRKAMRSLAVRRIAKRAHAIAHAEGRDAGVVIALSGTPITHHSGNLWPALEAMEPDAYPAGERFDDRYLLTSQGDYGKEILGLDPSTEPEFRMSMLGSHRRVAKADVLSQLPPKVYTVRTVEIPQPYRKAYDQMEEDMIAQLVQPDGTVKELSVMSVLAQLTRLSQLACAAADVDVAVVEKERKSDSSALSEAFRRAAGLGALGESEDREWHAGDAYEVTETTVTLKAPSWKVDDLLAVLTEREVPDNARLPRTERHQVVVFAPSRQLMMLAGTAVTEAGMRVGYIVGEQSPKMRTATIESFQAGDLDVICATTGAGGVGITLTAAKTVVFLQRPWSLVEALQAEDRCHRIGSEIHDSIEIIDIVASSTIDTRVRSVLRDKAGQLADLVQDPRIVSELLGGKKVTRIASGVIPKEESPTLIGVST